MHLFENPKVFYLNALLILVDLNIVNIYSLLACWKLRIVSNPADTSYFNCETVLFLLESEEAGVILLHFLVLFEVSLSFEEEFVDCIE